MVQMIGVPGASIGNFEESFRQAARNAEPGEFIEIPEGLDASRAHEIYLEVQQEKSSSVSLPSDRATRKGTPIWSGFLNYFPLAIAAVAQLSKSANDVHNPGEPLHWSKDKSNDHKDCMGRHQLDLGTYDSEPDHDYHYLHDVKAAWRALANLQILLETGKPPRIKRKLSFAEKAMQGQIPSAPEERPGPPLMGMHCS